MLFLFVCAAAKRLGCMARLSIDPDSQQAMRRAYTAAEGWVGKGTEEMLGGKYDAERRNNCPRVALNRQTVRSSIHGTFSGRLSILS